MNGPGFYYVNSMALDTSSNYNYMMIATDGNGLWVLKSPDDPVHFDLLASPYSTFGLLQQVRQDPEGGVYFFNDSAVVHYSPEHGFTPILSVHDLTNANIDINDIAADRYGKLYLATDNGIYIWENGAAERNINGADGIGPSPVVHTINIDAENRVWFSTQGYVGYLSAETPGQKNMIPIVPGDADPKSGAGCGKYAYRGHANNPTTRQPSPCRIVVLNSRDGDFKPGHRSPASGNQSRPVRSRYKNMNVRLSFPVKPSR